CTNRAGRPSVRLEAVVGTTCDVSALEGYSNARACCAAGEREDPGPSRAVISSAELFVGPGTRRTYHGRSLLIAALLGAAIANAHAEERVFELEIHSERPIAKPAVLAVGQNDQVEIRLRSDKPVQAHLH